MHTPAPDLVDITRRHALTYQHLLFRDPNRPGDAARAAKAHTACRKDRELLRHVLRASLAELLALCGDYYDANHTAPTLAEFRADLTKRFGEKLDETELLLREYETLAPTLLAPHLLDAATILERIVASRTWSSQNPYGPIRRRADGTFLDGSRGPILTGTPTSRLLWLYLYHHGGPITLQQLDCQLGCGLPSLQAAIRTLVRLGIVRRMHEPGYGTVVCLESVYTREAADARVQYQYSLTPAYQEELRQAELWKDKCAERAQERKRDARDAQLWRDARHRQLEPGLVGWTPLTEDVIETVQA
jgi:hypothetical protein